MRAERAGLGVVVASACWTGSTPPVVDPSPKAIATQTCTIADTNVEPATSPQLAYDGVPFARIEGKLDRLFVTVERDRASARVETSAVELSGELELEHFLVRPRIRALHDDWLMIDGATAVESAGNELRVDVDLPTGIAPRTIRVGLPCSTLTFDDADEQPEPPDTAEYLEFLPGTTTPVLDKPGGKTLVTVLTSKNADQDPPSVRVLERRAGFARVEIVGPHSTVVGWVPTAASQPSSRKFEGGFGFGRSGHSWAEVTCDRDLPVYVDGRGGQHVRVGRLKRGSTILINGDGNSRYVVNLGIPDAKVFVGQRELDECTGN